MPLNNIFHHTDTTIKPLLKWPGGKAQLADHLMPLVNHHPRGTFYEPFAGGAYVLLNQTHNRSVAGDVNPSVVGFYRSVMDDPDAVADELEAIRAAAPSDNKDESYWYQVRADYNRHQLAGEFNPRHAALLIAVNRWTFNGQYRVNEKGEMNNSFCKSYRATITREDIHNASRALDEADTTWRDGDFETICHDIAPGDTVFLDPPYIPIPGTPIMRYAHTPWTDDDHKRLADWARAQAERGVHVVATNHNLPETYRLWHGFHIRPLIAKRRSQGGEKHLPIEVIIHT